MCFREPIFLRALIALPDRDRYSGSVERLAEVRRDEVRGGHQRGAEATDERDQPPGQGVDLPVEIFARGERR